MAGQPSHQQLNIEHFNKHIHEIVNPHTLATADRVAEYLVQHLPECNTTETVALEFGCGLGLVSECLAPRVHSMFGVNVTPNAVEGFNKNAAAKGLSNMRAVCLDLLDANTTQQAISSGVLPAKFDLVVSHMVLHHVEDAAAAVASLSKLLRQEPQGRLVLTDLFATERTKYFHPASVHHTVSHLGGFSEQDIRQLLVGAGLEVTSFNANSVHMTKLVQQPDGSEVADDFPIFVAIAKQQA